MRIAIRCSRTTISRVGPDHETPELDWPFASNTRTPCSSIATFAFRVDVRN